MAILLTQLIQEGTWIKIFQLLLHKDLLDKFNQIYLIC